MALVANWTRTTNASRIPARTTVFVAIEWANLSATVQQVGMAANVNRTNRDSWAASVVKRRPTAFRKNDFEIKSNVLVKDVMINQAMVSATKIATPQAVISTEAIVHWVLAHGSTAPPPCRAGNCSRTRYAMKNVTTQNAFSTVMTAINAVTCNHVTLFTTPIAKAIMAMGDATTVVTMPNAIGTDSIANKKSRPS